MPKTLLFSALLLISFTSFSQDWNHFKPVQVEGEVPQVFTEAFSSKYNKERNAISKDDKRKTRKRKANFHKQSEFFIDEYLTGGRVMFGDTITNYCRAVLDKIIGDDPKLRDSIQLFTTKSPVVNATATANGIIFVNVGLIAQLETEAQLAYILAHELIHYTNKHVIDQYIEQEKISRGEDLYLGTSDDKKISALSNYSKNQEFEADEEGYTRFYSKSGYNFDAPFEVLDILQYAYLPFDEIPFENSIFESTGYSFPETYKLSEVLSIKADDDYDDENSTHPNLLKRRKNLNRIVTGTKGKNFIVSKESFFHCRKLARYELSHLFLGYRDYPSTIYNSFLLLKSDSLNRYARFSIAKALHGLSVYSNDGDLEDVLDDYEDIEGQSQQVYYLFNEMSKDELAILTVRYIYLLKKDYPDDIYIDELYKRTLRDLVFTNELLATDFIQSAKDTTIEDASDNDTVDIDDSYRSNNKIARIRSRKSRDEIEGDFAYWKYAFTDFEGDTTFWKDFEGLVDLQDIDSSYFDPQLRKGRKKFDKNLALGIDKITCIAPRYLKLDARFNDEVEFLKTEENSLKYMDYFKSISQEMQLDVNILDYKFSNNLDAQAVNHISLLQNWLSERMQHVNHDVVISSFDYVKPLEKQLDTPFLVHTGHITLKKAGSFNILTIYGLIIPYITPFILTDMFLADHISLGYCFLFDIRNGDALLADINEFELRDSPDYMKSIVYNYLLQISDQPK